MSRLSSTDLAWLAGFFDGEGSVGVYEAAGKTTFCLRVQISQLASGHSERLFSELRSMFGGSVCVLNKTGKRQALLWQCSGDKAVAFLFAIRPWLYFKAEQADLAMQWQTQREQVRRDSGGRILRKSEAEVQRSREVAQRLKEMKKV